MIDLMLESNVNTPDKYNPPAKGKQPDKKRNPEILKNCSLEKSLAIRYIATGGDQIELKPPRTPDIKPIRICQK